MRVPCLVVLVSVVTATVVVPSAEMGRVAATSLIRAIHDGTPPQGEMLRVDLVIRESTRIVPPRGDKA